MIEWIAPSKTKGSSCSLVVTQQNLLIPAGVPAECVQQTVSRDIRVVMQWPQARECSLICDCLSHFCVQKTNKGHTEHETLALNTTVRHQQCLGHVFTEHSTNTLNQQPIASSQEARNQVSQLPAHLTPFTPSKRMQEKESENVE